MKRIELTRGMWSMVDDADFIWLSQWNWCANQKGKRFYAYRTYTKNNRRVSLYMHQLILPKKAGFTTDHINGDSLDNRRSNLRYCTKKQNAANTGPYRKVDKTSNYKGVSRRSRPGRSPLIWRAGLTHCGKSIWIGNFANERQAALAYDAVIRDMYGDYAVTNFEYEASGEGGD